MNLNKGRAGCYYAASPLNLTKLYFSMPNIMLMTPETAETKIQAPSVTTTTVPTKPKTLNELNVAVPVTCVKNERVGYGCCNNGPSGNHEHGQT